MSDKMGEYWGLRLAEVERESHPGYYSMQRDQEPGHWRVDGGPGEPDGSRGVIKNPRVRSWRDTPSGQSWMGK